MKNTFESYLKFKNILLFVDYIKFSLQSFDCLIFCFEYFFFPISSLRIWFFFINFHLYSFDYYLFFSYYFLNWIFLFIRFGLYFFIWNNIWNYIYIFNFIMFQLFYLSNLVFILFIAIYFIWNNLWNWIFFPQIHSSSTFLFARFGLNSFNKLEKKLKH
jgi:hypothetical protein